jgi:conjugative transfer signal peptidase TraF
MPCIEASPPRSVLRLAMWAPSRLSPIPVRQPRRRTDQPNMIGRCARLARSAFLGVGACIGVFQICGWLGLRLNTSPSLPVGVYITTETGNLVEFCPAEPFASVALARGYRSSGVCPDGGAPLLKPVVATSGDVVDFWPGGLEVNNFRIPNTAPLSSDAKGRPLTHWPFGRYMVPTSMAWVASSYNGRSFDSRYFGPVAVTAIRDRVRPVLSF